MIFLTQKTKQELWTERIEAFLASGLSQRAWCEQQGMRPNQLSYWLRKLRTEARPSGKGRWVSLNNIAPSNSGVSLRIGNAVLEIERGFDPEVLADVLRSLMASC